MENILKKGGKDLKEIFNRIKHRDFSGNEGLVIKNSVYQIATNVFAKIGSMIFTIILARLLLPELFGLYSLALSTIIIFSAIAELGINQTLIRFVSKESSKKKNKVKSYVKYLGKIKVYFFLISSIILLFSAKIIAEYIYQKPIFLALLGGIFYILFIQILGFLQSLLQASNNFFSILKSEILFQILRVLFVPLGIVLILKSSANKELVTFISILILAGCFAISCLFLFFKTKKEYKVKFKNSSKNESLSLKQRKTINKFILSTTTLVLSGVFFGNIDRVMLGMFIESEFIGYYTAAYSLIGAMIPILGFASIVLFPIFSRARGEQLKLLLKKSIGLTILASIFAILGTILFSGLVVNLIYGNSYLPSVNILQFLSPLLFILPLAALYQSYNIAQGKPDKVAKLLIISTLLNIILNAIFILTFLKQGGPLAAVYGAALATIISQIVYLIGLKKK